MDIIVSIFIAVVSGVICHYSISAVRKLLNNSCHFEKLEIETPRCGNIGGFRFEVELYGLLVSILSNDIISYVKFICNILCNKIFLNRKLI